MTQICANCQTPNSDTGKFCTQCAAPLGQSLPQGQAGTGMLPANVTLQNRYTIVERLGRGGMGAVYAAVDTRIAGKRWAIKEMSDALLSGPQEKQAAISAFRREAEMLAQLSHPNLPAVTDFFSEGGKQYLVMELVQGWTLAAVLDAQQEPIPEGVVSDWAMQLCDVLTYLHERNPPIVFRDLKPSNIMLEETGRIKLIDFGIARLFKAGHAKDTQAMGTPGYAAPEQYGRGQTDARSDVYSLGVTMHNLLTRHDPGLSPFNLPPSRQLNPAISPGMDATVQRATQTNPQDRYGSIVEMRRAIAGSATTGAMPTRREAPAQPAPRPVTTPPVSKGRSGLPGWLWPALGAAALIVCLAVAVGAIAIGSQTGIFSGLFGGATETTGGGTAGLPATPLANVVSGIVIPPTDSAPAPTSVTPTEDTPPTVTVPPPAIVTELELGRSAGGLPLDGVRIGDGERAVVVIGGLHAGFAPSSVAIVERLWEHFVSNPADLPATISLYLLANVNPDSPRAPGELAGRLNANGVDLNRNWDCKWIPQADWVGTPVNAGDIPFSEPETQALRDFLLDLQPEVVIWYEARAADGLVAAGRCDTPHPLADRLGSAYAEAGGYQVDTFALNGDSSDWLVSQDIAAISVLLKEYDNVSDREWSDNLSGVRAVLDAIR